MAPYSSFREQIDLSLHRPLVEAAGLLLLTIFAVGFSWVLRSDSLSWQAGPTTYEMELSTPLVEVAEAMRLFDEGDYLFIDTRRDAALAETTISGAFIIREQTFDNDLLALMDQIFPEDPMILFGNGELSGVSNITHRLQGRGYENLLILRVGLKGWQLAGGQVSPPSPMELEAQ